VSLLSFCKHQTNLLPISHPHLPSLASPLEAQFRQQVLNSQPILEQRFLPVTMFSAIIPWCMTVTVLVLTILCIEAGHNTTYLQNRPIITINASDLKTSYEQKYGPTSAIHDVYKIYMKTFCYGDNPATDGAPLLNFQCTAPSSYCKSQGSPIHFPVL
jgi:hypothetical protein